MIGQNSSFLDQSETTHYAAIYARLNIPVVQTLTIEHNMEVGSEWPILDLQEPTSRGCFLFGVKNLSILFNSSGSPAMVPASKNNKHYFINPFSIALR